VATQVDLQGKGKGVTKRRERGLGGGEARGGVAAAWRARCTRAWRPPRARASSASLIGRHRARRRARPPSRCRSGARPRGQAPIPFAERITQFGEGDGTAQLLQRDLVVDKALAAGMGGGWERRRDGEC
jgi:hypothetical protein